MLIASSPSSSLLRGVQSKAPDQSDAHSPQRKKARRVSDPIDTVVRQQQAAAPRPAKVDNKSPNPLSLLCFALENEMDNKENIPPGQATAAALKTKTTKKTPFGVTSNMVQAPAPHTNKIPKKISLAAAGSSNKSILPEVVLSSPTVVPPSNHNYNDSQSSVGESLLVADASQIFTLQPSNLDASSTRPKRNYKPWAAQFEELLAYKKIYGNCRVPQKSPTYPSLARWIVYMRAEFKKGKLTNEKITKLERIGFEWSVGETTRAAAFDKKVLELQRFQRAHGHLNVLEHQNPALHYWCYLQRSKRSSLSMEQFVTLEKLGFDWGIYYDSTLQPIPTGGTFETEKLIVELQIYYRSHGDANVPPRYPPSPALAQWAYIVSTNDLGSQQIALMNSLGFVWRNECPYTDSRDMSVMTDHGYLSNTMVTRY
ncbi:hypothetical protein MPSEU_000447100 [Mayamaea pseudoterrestris]|nr:hypothetical protein MPSEU_000447100 [Mayamaea pseudoterrestris]